MGSVAGRHFASPTAACCRCLNLRRRHNHRSSQQRGRPVRGGDNSPIEDGRQRSHRQPGRLRSLALSDLSSHSAALPVDGPMGVRCDHVPLHVCLIRRSSLLIQSDCRLSPYYYISSLRMSPVGYYYYRNNNNNNN